MSCERCGGATGSIYVRFCGYCDALNAEELKRERELAAAPEAKRRAAADGERSARERTARFARRAFE
jgi:hypothetical protein